MARTSIQLPGSFSFTCSIPVRITDINYGGHAGNDAILSIIHEARMQYLHNLGYTEMQFAGTGMIMSDVTIQFKGELFYGDVVIASVTVGDISRIGFELYYLLEKMKEGTKQPVAYAKTSMICYDYDMKKIVAIPDEARLKMK